MHAAQGQRKRGRVKKKGGSEEKRHLTIMFLFSANKKQFIPKNVKQISKEGRPA